MSSVEYRCVDEYGTTVSDGHLIVVGERE